MKISNFIALVTFPAYFECTMMYDEYESVLRNLKEYHQHFSLLSEAAYTGNGTTCADLDPQFYTKINSIDEYGTPLLLISIQKCDFENFDFLLQSGANCNATDRYGNTALIVATSMETMQVCRTIFPDELFKADLLVLKIVDGLISAGAIVDWRNNYGQCALLNAIHSENLQLIDLLSEHSNCLVLALNFARDTHKWEASNHLEYILGSRVSVAVSSDASEQGRGLLDLLLIDFVPLPSEPFDNDISDRIDQIQTQIQIHDVRLRIDEMPLVEDCFIDVVCHSPNLLGKLITMIFSGFEWDMFIFKRMTDLVFGEFLEGRIKLEEVKYTLQAFIANFKSLIQNSNTRQEAKYVMLMEISQEVIYNQYLGSISVPADSIKIHFNHTSIEFAFEAEDRTYEFFFVGSDPWNNRAILRRITDLLNWFDFDLTDANDDLLLLVMLGSSTLESDILDLDANTAQRLVIHAALHDKYLIVHYILENNIQLVNEFNSVGLNPFMAAILGNSLLSLKVLMVHGADPFVQSDNYSVLSCLTKANEDIQTLVEDYTVQFGFRTR